MSTTTRHPDPEAVLVQVLAETSARADQNGATLDRSGTRKRILDAAIEMFAERGFEACSVRDLAREVGIKAPGLYSHFSSKEAILSEAMIRALADFLAYMAAPSEASTPVDRLGETVQRHVLYQIEHLSTARANDVLLDTESIGRFLPADDHALLTRTQRAYFEVVRSRLEAAAPPTFTVDSAITTFALINLCDRVTAWYKPSGRLTPNEVAHSYWNLVKGMLRI